MVSPAMRHRHQWCAQLSALCALLALQELKVRYTECTWLLSLHDRIQTRVLQGTGPFSCCCTVLCRTVLCVTVLSSTVLCSRSCMTRCKPKSCMAGRSSLEHDGCRQLPPPLWRMTPFAVGSCAQLPIAVLCPLSSPPPSCRQTWLGARTLGCFLAHLAQARCPSTWSTSQYRPSPLRLSLLPAEVARCRARSCPAAHPTQATCLLCAWSPFHDLQSRVQVRLEQACGMPLVHLSRRSLQRVREAERGEENAQGLEGRGAGGLEAWIDNDWADEWRRGGVRLLDYNPLLPEKLAAQGRSADGEQDGASHGRRLQGEGVGGGASGKGNGSGSPEDAGSSLPNQTQRSPSSPGRKPTRHRELLASWPVWHRRTDALGSSIHRSTGLGPERGAEVGEEGGAEGEGARAGAGEDLGRGSEGGVMMTLMLLYYRQPPRL